MLTGSSRKIELREEWRLAYKPVYIIENRTSFYIVHGKSRNFSDEDCVRRVEDDLIFYEGHRTTCIVTTSHNCAWIDEYFADAVGQKLYTAICGSNQNQDHQVSERVFQDSCISASVRCQSDHEHKSLV